MELSLLAAHMLGDFVFQTDSMAKNKFSSFPIRTLHVLCYCACFVPFLLLWHISLWRASSFLLVLFIGHWLTDCRRWSTGNAWPAKPILVDQALHIAQIAVLYWAFLR